MDSYFKIYKIKINKLLQVNLKFFLAQLLILLNLYLDQIIV